MGWDVVGMGMATGMEWGGDGDVDGDAVLV